MVSISHCTLACVINLLVARSEMEGETNFLLAGSQGLMRHVYSTPSIYRSSRLWLDNLSRINA